MQSAKNQLVKHFSLKDPGNYASYLFKFIAVFGICYLGTFAIIGLAAPGGFYSPFIDHHLDYVSWIKNSLIYATGFILSWFNIHTHTEFNFLIRINGGRGVYIARDCVGFGVYSFWIAFVVANSGTIIKKVKWIVAGLLSLWLINVTRITLFLVAINKGWPMPLGIDHHTWFIIFAYALIGILIFCYDKSFTYNILKSGKKQ